MLRRYAEQNVLVTASLVVLAVVALAAALIYTRAVMIPFVVALFIVALVAPIEDFQVKKLRLPRFVAVIVTLLVVLSVMALVSLFVYQSAQTIVSTAGEYSASFAYMANRALKPIESLYRDERSRSQPKPASAPGGPNEVKRQLPAPAIARDTKPPERKPGILELYPVVGDSNKAALEVTPRVTPPVKEPNETAIAAGEPNGLSKRELRIDTRQMVLDLRNYIFNIVTNAFGRIFGLTSGVLFVSVFVIFLLAGRNPYAEHSQVYREVVQKVRRYVGTKVVVSAIVGVLVWLTLHKIGMELAGVFGVLTFLLNFIPSIGAIIATLLPIPIAVVEFGDTPSLIILVVVVPTVIHNIMGNFIEPKLMGSGLDLHPVTILLALSFWGLLWGVVGMLLAAPITAALRIVLMQFETLRPVANLLAGDFTKPAQSLT
jgi:AI-2 transport protein TqsA